MKNVRWIAFLLTILFCIDYSVTQLLGFSFLYTWFMDQRVLRYVYAFVIGVCGFINILSLKKDED